MFRNIWPGPRVHRWLPYLPEHISGQLAFGKTGSSYKEYTEVVWQQQHELGMLENLPNWGTREIQRIIFGHTGNTKK